MKHEITKTTDTSTTLTVKLDREALLPHVKATFDRLRAQVKAAGFRPGKAPDHIVERELGASAVQNEVLDEAIRHSYAKAVTAENLPVIAPPEVAIAKFVPFDELEFTATVEILPKVKLANYKSIKVKKPEVKVEDKDVEAVIEDLRQRMKQDDKLPEVDNKFASELGPFKDLAELKSDIRKRVEAEKTEQARHQWESTIINEIIKKSQLKLPERLVKRNIERLKSEMSQNLAYSGMDLDKYLTSQKKTMEELEKDLTPEAEKRVGIAIVLTEIAKAEGLTVAHDEIHDEIERLKQQYPDPEMQKELAAEQIHEEVYNHLLAQKTVNKILSYLE